jgi:hypothetical protein
MKLLNGDQMKIIKIELSILFFWLCCSVPASAQLRSPRAEVKITYGFYGYDEDLSNAIGGAFAYYPNTRTSGELELLYLFDRDHKKYHTRGFALTPSFGADFRHNPVIFQPYGRLAETIDRIDKSIHSNLTVRLGFRVYIGNRFFISPEFGFGQNLNYRFTVSAGYVTATQTLPNVRY